MGLEFVVFFKAQPSQLPLPYNVNEIYKTDSMYINQQLGTTAYI